MDGKYAMTGSGATSSRRSSLGSAHQGDAPSLHFIPGDARSPTIDHEARQVIHSEPPYHDRQQQGPTMSEQRAPHPGEVYGHPPPAMQPAPPSDFQSRQPMQISAQMPYRPGPPPPPPPLPMNVQPGTQGVVPRAAGSITPQHGRDHHNLSFSRTNVSNAMPLQVSGLNFQYDQSAPYRPQTFAPRLPLSQSISHGAPTPAPRPQPPRHSTDYGAGAYAQSRILHPSSRQNPIDLTQSISTQPTAGPSTPQSASHPGRHHRQSSLCTPFCQADCPTPHHGMGNPSQQSLAPPILPLQPGDPAPPPPPPPMHYPRPPSEPSAGVRSFNGHPWGDPAFPPTQQRPPQPPRQPAVVQQQPPAPERPPAPEQLPASHIRPPSQQRPHLQQQSYLQQQPQLQQQPHLQQQPPSQNLQSSLQQNGTSVAPRPNTHPSSQTTQPPAQQVGFPVNPRANAQPSSRTEQSFAQQAGPSVIPRDNPVVGSAAPSHPAVRGPGSGENLQHAQKAIFNDAMMTALTPLQSGVEQLWGHVVEQFHTVLERVTITYTEVLQAEGDKVIRAEERVKELESDNMKMLQQRCELGKKMTSLQKEMEDLKETMKDQNYALVASQREVAMLAGEKGRLEVELSSLRNVGRKVADSGISPPAQLVSILLQQEIAMQVEGKLRDAHQEVEEHLIARHKVEKQLNGMKEKLKALVGYDIGDLEKRSPISPSRETSTVVGTPPPKPSYHSRKPSNDMMVSPPPVSPLIQSSLPPSSVPTSPVVLRAAPPIERRPSPRPHLPTPPISAAVLKPSIAGKGAQEETARSFSVPPRPISNLHRSATTPVVVAGAEESGHAVGMKRSRSAAGPDPGEPAPVRRLTVDSEGPRREGLQSRSRGPHVPAPPIASIPLDGTISEHGVAMDVDPPQQPVMNSPVPPVQTPSLSAPPPPPPLVQEAEVKLDSVKEDPPVDSANDGREDGGEEEKVAVKLEDELDQLMDELISYDDELEEGEVTDTEEAIVHPAPEEEKRLSPPPASLGTAPTARTPTPPTLSPAEGSRHYREHVAEQGVLSPLPQPPQQALVSPPPVDATTRASSPSVPSSRSWASTSSSYVPPARSWAQAYPGRPAAAAPVKEERVSKLPPGPPKLSVLKHWDLLYVEDGTQWKCRLCQTMPNPGKPRAAFDRKTETHDVMLQHSQKEHPVACADMAKLAPDKLAEMKARLR